MFSRSKFLFLMLLAMLSGCGAANSNEITGAFGIQLGERLQQSAAKSIRYDGQGSHSDQVVYVWEVIPPDPEEPFSYYSVSVNSDDIIVRIFAKTDRVSDCRYRVEKLWPDLKEQYGRGGEKGGRIEQESAVLKLDCSYPSPGKSGTYMSVSYWRKGQPANKKQSDTALPKKSTQTEYNQNSLANDARKATKIEAEAESKTALVAPISPLLTECLPCHGSKLQGMEHMGPSLVDKNWMKHDYSIAEIANVIRDTPVPITDKTPGCGGLAIVKLTKSDKIDLIAEEIFNLTRH